MIAPKIVSRVQPSGRDYSDRTSPDIIDSVPASLDRRDSFSHWSGRPATPVSLPVEPAMPHDDEYEAGRITVAGVVLLCAVVLGLGMLAALTMAGLPTEPAWTVGNYR